SVDWKLELVQVPVTDVDRAKALYTEKVGFTADHDPPPGEELRFVHPPPRGPPCPVAIGTGLSDMPPGTVRGLQLVVADVESAREQLVEDGVDVSEVQGFPGGRFV